MFIPHFCHMSHAMRHMSLVTCHVSCVMFNFYKILNLIFKALAQRAVNWFVHMFVCLCFCLSVCLSVCSLLRYRLNVFSPPLSKVGCPKVLKIWNPGKSYGKVWFHIWKLLVIKSVKSHCKIFLFWGEFWKDQDVIQQGSDGYTTRIRRSYNKDKEVISRIFLVLVLLYASFKRCFVSRMWVLLWTMWWS